MDVSEKSPLELALEKGMAEGGNLSQELATLGDCPIESERDALAVCAALKRLRDSLGNKTSHLPAGVPVDVGTKPSVDSCDSHGSCQTSGDTGAGSTCETGEPCDHGPADEAATTATSPLHPLASLFQDAETDEAYTVLQQEGLPLLLDIFNQRLPIVHGDEEEDLIFLLKIFVVYGYEPGMARIAAALRRPLNHDLFIWGVLFETVHDEHPDRQYVCDQLRNPLPTGFAGIAYLDMVNNMSEHGEAKPHPFDTPEGMALLRQWAISDSAEEASYAQSVAHAIPFLTRPERSELLDVLSRHDDVHIQADAAYAAAKLGDAPAVQKLAELSEDASVSYFACQYLKQLGREDLIAEIARDPHFKAVSEMCAWLSQPDAYGEIPDEIEIMDYREADWPPTSDRRPLWLLKYSYAADPNDPEDFAEVGVGMVGSETAVLFDETFVHQAPEEIYAMHCCWELEQNGDERAPEENSVEAGLKILNWS